MGVDLRKKDNTKHITVKDWFITDLHLKGNELLVYAIVYSFSEDGQGCFYGSLDWIAKRLQTSKSMVCNVLAKLVDKGLLKKETKALVNGGFGCVYTVNLIVDIEEPCYQNDNANYQNDNGHYQNDNDTVTKMVTNNKYNNKDITKVNNKETEKPSETKTQKVITDRYCDVYQSIYGQKFTPISKDFWVRASRLIKTQLGRFTIEQLCSAIDMARNDEWVKSKGFDLNIILSTNMIERYLNPNYRNRPNIPTQAHARTESYDWDKIV